MLDLKILHSALQQLETERGIPKEKIIEVIQDALAAAYKKDYGKRGQIIRAEFDFDTGKTGFQQIKKVVDKDMVRMDEEEIAEDAAKQPKEKSHKEGLDETNMPEEEKKIRFNPEHHILLEDARKIKKNASVDDELVFPLESKDDYGRIAAQTAKQVIIQKIREAERFSVMGEYEKRRGEIVSGTIQRIERGNIYVDLGRTTGVIPQKEQIPREYFRQGERIKAYLYAVEETQRDITLRLSRSHPRFLQKLLEIEVPEIASGVVEVKSVAREPGSRSKIAVCSHDEHIDPVGSCVGQRGVRVSTVMSELGGEKIDIIEWIADPEQFIERALSPAQVINVTLDEKAVKATIEVAPDQYSLAIGRGGQNARLAAKLTGWKIDIREAFGRQELQTDGEGDKQPPEKQAKKSMGIKETIEKEEKEEKNAEEKTKELTKEKKPPKTKRKKE